MPPHSPPHSTDSATPAIMAAPLTAGRTPAAAGTRHRDASAASGLRRRPRRAAEIGNYHYGQGHPMKVRPSKVCRESPPQRSLPRPRLPRDRAAQPAQPPRRARAECASVQRILTYSVPPNTHTRRVFGRMSPRPHVSSAGAMMVADRSWTFCGRPRPRIGRTVLGHRALTLTTVLSRARGTALFSRLSNGSRTAYA